MPETDLAIIGAGVAGLTAAAEAARLGLRVLVIERMGAGGQVMNVERIDNMPGFPAGISGFELGPDLQERAEAAGAQFMLDTVQGYSSGASGHVLHCEGQDIAARAVLVAAGSRRRALGVPGEDRLAGRGVSHCASCDGPLFRGQPVCVVGGGDSAFGEALVLAQHVRDVLVVFREKQPHAQTALREAVAAQPRIALQAETEVVGIVGEDTVAGVMLRDRSGSVREVEAGGVFVYAGLQAETEFLGGALRLDADGRIVTDTSFGTSVAGIFAAGDIRSGVPYLLAAAVEEGRSAAQAAFRYLSETTLDKETRQ
ncbi:FAD-binding protein [Ramlibacter henchirensis]|uniref:FAD-binding protein n=1 Tax=Ramlibacter henchirensis TaxID=204072 RepID=A0A4Z0C584_9BURK|nr:FAD-dependent oxidoreductase [Ramlibacter henchirensis]TFZ05610.1 FAD-binding protein [Ramlibacter henchirensis]